MKRVGAPVGEHHLLLSPRVRAGASLKHGRQIDLHVVDALSPRVRAGASLKR